MTWRGSLRGLLSRFLDDYDYAEPTDAPVDEFEAVKNRIRDQIETYGFNSTIGAYTRTLGGSELDASILLMPIVRYCDAGTPRMQSTWQSNP